MVDSGDGRDVGIPEKWNYPIRTWKPYILHRNVPVQRILDDWKSSQPPSLSYLSSYLPANVVAKVAAACPLSTVSLRDYMDMVYVSKSRIDTPYSYQTKTFESFKTQRKRMADTMNLLSTLSCSTSLNDATSWDHDGDDGDDDGEEEKQMKDGTTIGIDGSRCSKNNPSRRPNHNSRTIVLVSHGGPVTHLYESLTGNHWNVHGVSKYCSFSIYYRNPTRRQRSYSTATTTATTPPRSDTQRDCATTKATTDDITDDGEWIPLVVNRALWEEQDHQFDATEKSADDEDTNQELRDRTNGVGQTSSATSSSFQWS